jgi:RNA polymerase sigma-70 factor (family 1)
MKKILNNLNDNDPSAFNIIYKQFFSLVYSIVLKLVGDREIAKDITADVFLKIWEKKIYLQDLVSVRGYLIAISRNACNDYYKTERRSDNILSEFQYLSEQSLAIEENTAEIKGDVIQYYLERVEELPTQCRTIFKLYLEGMRNLEIAEYLNISEKTVRNQKTLARTLLQKRKLAIIILLTAFFS